jgi:integrase
MPELKDQIYDTDARLKNAISGLDEKQLCKQNRIDIERLAYELLGQDDGEHHAATVVRCLSNLDHLIDFELRSASRQQVVKLVSDINRNKVSESHNHKPWTLCQYKKAVRIFFREHDFRENHYGFIKTRPKKSETNRIRREQLITVSEIEELINNAKNWRDKAFIALLWDSGMRISEILSMKWKHIKFLDEMAKVHIANGKNGQRTIYPVESVPLLKKWKQETAFDDAENAIWKPFNSGGGDNDVITYKGITNQLRKIRDRADIPSVRKTNPHAFRKARATCFASRGMTQPNLNQHFGWVPGSMASVWYIQLAERDLEKAARRMYGLPIEEDEYEKVIGNNIEYYNSDMIAEVA